MSVTAMHTELLGELYICEGGRQRGDRVGDVRKKVLMNEMFIGKIIRTALMGKVFGDVR